MGLVNQYVVGKKPDFGKIDIRKNECIFGIEKEFIDSVISQVSGNKFEGRVVEVRKDTKINNSHNLFDYNLIGNDLHGFFS